MCGILGALPTVDSVSFSKVLDLLEHRGPDGASTWSDGPLISLGHRRLAILDTAKSADQPMHFAQRFTLVFNGEIYNFLELRRTLSEKGYSFQTESDSEVLLAAFAEWKEQCVTRLNGMWAFAIWDRVERRLFLSRDRMGEKPLYYIQDRERFFFASEQKALLPFLPQVRASRRFNHLVKDAYAYEATTETLFEGISRFPAAHSGWYIPGTGKNLKLSRYWSPLDSSISVAKNYSEQVEQLRELLLDSTRLRMRSDVPIGTALSGGVDSSAIAACMSQIGGKPEKSQQNERVSQKWQNSFVAGFPGTVMDETADAGRVAQHLGTRHQAIVIDPSESAKSIENKIFVMEDIHEVNPIPHMELYRAIRDHQVLVTLDGHGGDELFCGYESSILHALPAAIWNQTERKQILETYQAIHPEGPEFSGLSGVAIGLYLVKAKIRSRLLGNEVRGRDLDSLNQHLLELSTRTVLPTLLRNYDRYAMASGVEIRMPFLDPRVVEFAFRLPWTSKIRNGYTKSILRDAVAPWLPAEVIYRKKKIGFSAPIAGWMRGPLKTYLLDSIRSHDFAQSTRIDPVQVRREIEELIEGDQRNSLQHYSAEQVWKKFSIFLWEKVFLRDRLWKVI